MKKEECCQEMAEYQSSPHVSLLIPFEPKMKNKLHLEKILSDYAAQTERDLLKKYECEKVVVVMDKLRSLIEEIDDTTHKDIAIFVNSSTKKVIYFNHSDYLQTHPYPKV